MEPINLQINKAPRWLFFLFFSFLLFSSLYSLSIPCWDRTNSGGGADCEKKVICLRQPRFFFHFSFSFLKSRAFEVECEASNIVGVWKGVEGWGWGRVKGG